MSRTLHRATPGHAVSFPDSQRRVLATILELARQIEGWTIEKVLTKSDLQLGIEAVRNGFGRPR